MDRKQFLGNLFVLPFGLFLVHCSSSGSSGSSGSDAPDAPPVQSGGQDIYTSSFVESHHHTATIDDTDFSAPPSAGVTESTSSDPANSPDVHAHMVTVSAAQLAQVATGASVQVTSSSTNGHTHVFTFVKIG